ncbi:MAG: hypothetical protein P8P52_07725 [Opitutae bacterium]|nr:hypothetical protein [Opitutae bacterium]
MKQIQVAADDVLGALGFAKQILVLGEHADTDVEVGDEQQQQQAAELIAGDADGGGSWEARNDLRVVTDGCGDEENGTNKPCQISHGSYVRACTKV